VKQLEGKGGCEGGGKREVCSKDRMWPDTRTRIRALNGEISFSGERRMKEGGETRGHPAGAKNDRQIPSNISPKSITKNVEMTADAT